MKTVLFFKETELMDILQKLNIPVELIELKDSGVVNKIFEESKTKDFVVFKDQVIKNEKVSAACFALDLIGSVKDYLRANIKCRSIFQSDLTLNEIGVLQASMNGKTIGSIAVNLECSVDVKETK